MHCSARGSSSSSSGSSGGNDSSTSEVTGYRQFSVGLANLSIGL